jgi:hypothetical protein
VKSQRLNTKSANVLKNPLKKIYYYQITKLIGMSHPSIYPAHLVRERPKAGGVTLLT